MTQIVGGGDGTRESESHTWFVSVLHRSSENNNNFYCQIMKLLESSVLLFGIHVFICFLKLGILIYICNLLANKRLYFVGCNWYVTFWVVSGGYSFIC